MLKSAVAGGVLAVVFLCGLVYCLNVVREVAMICCAHRSESQMLRDSAEVAVPPKPAEGEVTISLLEDTNPVEEIPSAVISPVSDDDEESNPVEASRALLAVIAAPPKIARTPKRPEAPGDSQPVPKEPIILQDTSIPPALEKIHGIVLGENVKVAVLLVDGRIRRIELGEVFAGWRLVELFPRAAVIESPDGRTETVRLFPRRL